MLEILKFYVSGFWIWAGITFGLVIAGSIVVDLLKTLFDFIVRLVRGGNTCHCENKTLEKKEKPKSKPGEYVAFAEATATADFEVKGAKKNGSKETK